MEGRSKSRTVIQYSLRAKERLEKKIQLIRQYGQAEALNTAYKHAKAVVTLLRAIEKGVSSVCASTISSVSAMSLNCVLYIRRVSCVLCVCFVCSVSCVSSVSAVSLVSTVSAVCVVSAVSDGCVCRFRCVCRVLLIRNNKHRHRADTAA